MKIAVIGTGRVGTSLGNSLAQAGYEIAGLADADPAAARRARRIIGRGRVFRDPVAALRSAKKRKAITLDEL
ncbi:MAG TPA: 3-hydroxyacyl-CoA dehydrogenase NAD-binding domain-containing protein, partial [Candidatus Aminicenantes bacterium]|nr:3-hydroxyacyl-CoA dehydrogenase NAD-binding domain-containing protein [Candidatus Aminicenantes bacterium]